MMESGWDFRILGPLEVSYNGRAVPIRAAKQRVLLAVLLADADRVVPVETLATRLWASVLPRAHRNTVQNYVMRLRRALVSSGGPDPVVTRPNGYAVEIGEQQLDVRRFDALVRRAKHAATEGRLEQVCAVLSQALTLWRGQPLVDAPSEYLHREFVPALTESRLNAIELRIAAAISLGRHQDVLAELRELTTNHPLREQFWAQRMLALYRSGRQAEALVCYRTIHRLLDDELGIYPGAELQRLHQQVLTADPELAVSRTALVSEIRTPVTVAEPSRVAHRLVGRDRELAALDKALTEVAAGRPRAVEIVGEPGIGKTSLLDVVHAKAAHPGWEVLVGRALERQSGRYGAFLDAMDDRVAGLSPDRIALLGGRHRELLATVFPALSSHAKDNLTAEDQHQLRRAVRTLLEVIADRSCLVLILDDLHWADEATIELVDHLLRHPPRVPLLLAMAYRPRQAPAQLVHVLAGAGQASWWERLTLAGLSPTEAAMRWKLPEQRMVELHKASGGNPFYLDSLSTDDEPTPQARAALLGEFAGLPPASLLALRSAAVLGDTFDPTMISQVAELGESETLAALDDLIARDLIRQDEGSRSFRFRHPLLRQVVNATVGPGWRQGARTRAATKPTKIYADTRVYQPEPLLSGLPLQHREARRQHRQEPSRSK
jgi:DNA-binding SARP family transcriptional activator